MTTWHAISAPPPVIVKYGYTAYFNTERLTSVFNWGFGDLSVSDLRIGSTPIEQFNSWQRNDSVTPPGQGDRTQLLGYTTPGWAGSSYPGNVESVDGGKLEQRPGIANGGWIERRGSEGAHLIQIDIAGRLFRQANGGVEQLACYFEAEYIPETGGGWVPFSFSPFGVSSGSTTPVRVTFPALLSENILYVRVRRVTPEPASASEVIEMEWTRLKFFRNTDALYPAQHRTGLIINATGQLSGRIERLGGLVRAKHWAWNSGAPWTPGLFPGDGAAPWVWGPTVNPADLFLYYARGGFLNATAGPGYMGGQRGWLDRPDATNGARLFGAGLVDARIDYAAIVAWRQFCAAYGLECRMVIDEQKSAGEVLDDIAAAGRASKSWATGKLSVVWEAPGQPVIAAFGMSNIVAGTFKVAYDTDTSVDEFVLNYTRVDDDYEPASVRAAVPGATQLVNQSTDSAVYSMSQGQAQRLVNLLAASRKYHRRRITWESTLEALAVQRGDVVQLAHDLTQWAYSGRLVAMAAVGSQVTQVTLSCAVANPTGAGGFYLWIRKPNGTFMSIACVPPIGSTNVLVPTGWATADAPGVLGQTLDSQNVASNWPDTIPEDWMFLAGPTPTPGKRARIVAIEPSSNRKVRITARDEYEEYYPLEYGLGWAPEPASGERLVARAYNLSATAANAGGTLLRWELEAATGAEVAVSVNGGAAAQVPVQGFLTVSGTQLLLPAYAPGTQLAIQLLPVAAGTPVAIEGDSLHLSF